MTVPEDVVELSTFDVLNRMTRSDVSRAAGVGGTTQETFEYDGLSRLTRCTDDNGGPGMVQTIERDYDSLSRLLEERQNDQPVSTIPA